MAIPDLQILSSIASFKTCNEQFINILAYNTDSLLDFTTPLPIMTYINKQHHARINACGISLFTLYDRTSFSEYIHDKYFRLTIVPDVELQDYSETIPEDLNIVKKEILSSLSFETSQDIKEQFSLYKKYLEDFDEEIQLEIFEELYITAELFVNEYLKVKTSYHEPISEKNYTEALLYAKADKLPA